MIFNPSPKRTTLQTPNPRTLHHAPDDGLEVAIGGWHHKQEGIVFKVVKITADLVRGRQLVCGGGIWDARIAERIGVNFVVCRVSMVYADHIIVQILEKSSRLFFARELILVLHELERHFAHNGLASSGRCSLF